MIPYSPDIVIHTPPHIQNNTTQLGVFIEDEIAKLVPETVSRFPPLCSTGDFNESGYYGFPIVSDIKCTTYVNQKLSKTLTVQYDELISWRNMVAGKSVRFGEGIKFLVVIRRYEALYEDNSVFSFKENILWQPSIPFTKSKNPRQEYCWLDNIRKNVISEVDILNLGRQLQQNIVTIA
jgi:hypothetical protein